MHSNIFYTILKCMAAATASVNNGSTSLADILVTQGALSAPLAERVKLAEIQTGKSQEDVLREQKLVTEDALVRAKAGLYNIPYIDLTTTPISPDALAILSQEVAERFHVFPISIDPQ